MSQFKITLKPRHQEELERLRQALGGVSPSVAISFLLQNCSSKAINAIENSTYQHLSSTELPQVVPSGTNQVPSSTEVVPTVPKGTNSVPIISESEAALNALMDSFN